MSDEEKKIIETINYYIKKKEELCDLGDDFTINFRDTKPLKTLINLIDKQQKEIEREKQYSDFYKDLCNKQQKLINQLLEDMKERANNFSYESVIMWRKIEKAEELLKEE